MSTLFNYRTTILTALLLLFAAAAVANDDIEQKETIEVIGVTVTHGVGLPEEVIPYKVQSASSDDIETSQTFGLTDFLNTSFSSITINDAQNNPLQADLQYRGYTLSPLLGLPQGLAVFQDGVRINEVFGDTMNWDVLPKSSIANINLIGGANPIFGLNTLGGALSITTKNGFTHPGHSIAVGGGSFERIFTTLSSGANNGTWGYFISAEYFDEEGWRDASPSDAANLFAVASYRDANTTADLSLNVADTDLIGNGSTPAELLAVDRSAVFTSPDQTENQLTMLNLSATHWVNNTMQLSGNAFYRKNETDSFNGDGSEFEECEVMMGDPREGFLCEEDDDEAIEDQFGMMIPEDAPNGEEYNAINNISNRDQESFGANLQITLTNSLFGRDNQFIFGGGYQQGLIDFFSAVEIAQLNCVMTGDCSRPSANRSTTRTSIFVPEEGTNIKAHHRIWSLYATDTLSVNDRLTLTASLRYNNSHIVVGDRSSETNLADPEEPDDLNGEHDFDRVNPAVGATYKLNDDNSVYGSYSESSRVPTPVELLCSHPDAPCNLPNTFLADPPLDQVVTKSYELGFRGTVLNNIRYEISGYHSTNNDDILFGSTGGVSSNEGFFRNVGDTRRLGGELSLFGALLDEKLQWALNYSYIEATFEEPFLSVSANHPNAADLGGGTDGNDIQVSSGDRIPGIPEHALKFSTMYAFNSKISAGFDVIYNSNQVIRGDESNELSPIDGYTIVNLKGSYRFNKHLTLSARIYNLFDTDYETFGLLGEPDEIFDAFSDPRFFGAGAPISGFIEAKLSF